MYIKLNFYIILLSVVSTFAGTPEDSLKIQELNNNLSYIDSLILQQEQYFLNENNDEVVLNPYLDSVPKVNELMYMYRITELNKTSAIKLNYNAVIKNYIEMYTVRKRKLMSKILSRSKMYFPIFDEYFDKYNLPLELKYLAIVESALNPKARSRSGAVGLWQFMFNTGKMLDLQITSYIDQRNDVYKSTEAACRYLEYLYRTFNDWELALAAYNGGPGTVRNAIALSGGKTNFWEIRAYLPKETQGYVPAYIAAFYAFEYSKEHNIQEAKLEYNYNNIDTISIKGDLSLQKTAEALNISYTKIKKLNPMYKRGVIPNNNKTHTLVLPKNKILEFLELKPSLINISNIKTTTDIFCGKRKITHVVKKGEYFHKIALNYRCTIEDLLKWNNIETRKIYAGQELIIYNLHNSTL